MSWVQRDLRREDGTPLRAWRGGEGDLDVLLVPGFFGDVDVFAGLLGILAPRARLHSWDLRGLGDGERSVDLEDHASDGLRVLDAAEAREVVLIGYGAGAPIAAEITRQAPERVIGFISIAGVFGGPVERILRRFVGPAAESLPLALGAGALAGRGHRVPVWLADALRSRWTVRSLRVIGLIGEHGDPRPLEEALVRTFGRDAGAQAAAWSALAEYLVEGARVDIAVPSLWLSGARDPLAGPMVARLAAAGATTPHLRVVRGGGHLLPLEQPELLGLWIEDFLAEHGLFKD
ncbi:MAG: alpha/beta hydrolase [Deltaproteobacteria bacterium]|nr:alpha/beta hydrolase [Deltaproteobacteria bacterium]